jgi:hypothetical protein
MGLNVTLGTLDRLQKEQFTGGFFDRFQTSMATMQAAEGRRCASMVANSHRKSIQTSTPTTKTYSMPHVRGMTKSLM